nr:class I SAM-dependent methyltransferase [Candidatus Bathyarchaeota archaeon]NIW13598.1 class I SAM-dependent methyltransferase [Candidatus Thorarchaeota archaeon]
MLTKQELVSLYQKRAKNYDLFANLYYLIGFRELVYRKQAVAALNLKTGDTVVEIACGTGLNFSLLHNAVGPSGKIIGVDITDKMLEQAQQRIDNHGWANIELIKTDAADYIFPKGINGIISVFAITLIPEYAQIIENGSRALAKGGRFAILDFKEPENRPLCLTKLFVFLTKGFGVSLDLAV